MGFSRVNAIRQSQQQDFHEYEIQHNFQMYSYNKHLYRGMYLFPSWKQRIIPLSINSLDLESKMDLTVAFRKSGKGRFSFVISFIQSNALLPEMRITDTPAFTRGPDSTSFKTRYLNREHKLYQNPLIIQ